MRIAVAGLGIGGSAAALGLARQGHEVTVFEQAASPGPAGAGFLLQPSGQAALDRLALLDEVTAGSWPIRSFHAGKAPGRGLITLRYDRRDPDVCAFGVARGALFTALHRACLGAGVRVVPGTRVVRVMDDGAVVEPAATDGTSLGSFDLLVVADGARSTLRTAIDPGATIRLSNHAALWGLGDAETVNEPRLWQEARGTAILAGLLPVGERRTAVFWGVRADDLDDLLAGDWDAFVDRVGSILPAAVPVLRTVGGFDGLAVARYGVASLRRTHRGRLVAIGDAAHAGPPHLGQGANLALLDAEALVDALLTDGPIETRLAAYDRRRRWQNRRYALLSRSLAPFFQSDLALLGPLRDLALPVMGAAWPIRALMERVLAGGASAGPASGTGARGSPPGPW